MIECTDKNVYYKRRKKPKNILRVFVLLLILGGLIFYYKNVVEVFIVNVCSDNLKSFATQSVNSAVLSVIEDDPYNELVRVEKNESGDIVLITTDAVKANEINKKLAQKVERIISEKVKKGFDVPVLAFTGIKFLSGYGFNVNLKTISITSVECNFDDTFVSAGINQTMHSLYLSVKTTAILDIPSDKRTETVVTKVLLGEAVIVGKVPEIYLSQ